MRFAKQKSYLHQFPYGNQMLKTIGIFLGNYHAVQTSTVNCILLTQSVYTRAFLTILAQKPYRTTLTNTEAESLIALQKSSSWKVCCLYQKTTIFYLTAYRTTKKPAQQWVPNAHHLTRISVLVIWRKPNQSHSSRDISKLLYAN